MLKTALLAALCGISVAKVNLAYDGKSSKNSGNKGSESVSTQDMCCTANAGVDTAFTVCKGQSSEKQCKKAGQNTRTGDYLCQWVSCADVGYCVDPRDDEFYDEELRWEQRQMLDADWGSTKPVKTPRPTVWRAPKTTRGPKTPKVKTTRVKTTKDKTPRPTRAFTKTPRPTRIKTTKYKEPKTPKPTIWRAPKTTRGPKTTRDKTPRPA